MSLNEAIVYFLAYIFGLSWFEQNKHVLFKLTLILICDFNVTNNPQTKKEREQV